MRRLTLPLLLFTLTLGGCMTHQPQVTVDRTSAVPGTSVSRQGNVLALVGTGIEVGQPLPATSLIDAMTLEPVDLRDYRGEVLFLGLVPSIDTTVCDVQTHLLGEEGDMLPTTVRRITISRDTPFAQKRFAKEGDLTDLQYLSDYQEGEFGESLGLLLDGSRLLARSVILVDKKGIVRYIQVVPDISHLPDMTSAFAKAIELQNF